MIGDDYTEKKAAQNSGLLGAAVIILTEKCIHELQPLDWMDHLLADYLTEEKEVGPSGGGPGNFKNFTTSQEDEDAFNFVKWRNVPKPSGILGSTAHMVKGALGAGILGGHVAYKKAGVCVAIPMNFIFGVYIAYCLYLLVKCAQILNKRTRVPKMTYSDVGEAAVACFPNPKISRFSRKFRYLIDAVLCIDLFGACAVYQIIISKTVKQLVENKLVTEIEGMGEGYPNLRVYLAAFLIPVILICLIIHLKWLAPFSLVANFVILFCICLGVYYAFQFNPSFENMVTVTGFYEFLEYVGLSVFSMSCAGIVIPIENNMRNPNHFNIVLSLGMSLIILCTFMTSFFGYVAFLEKAESPITINFPLTLWPKILKGGIAIMIYVTHALNFWVPFNICFYYLSFYHKTRLFCWELFYRALFVCIIAIVAIIFPTINALMGVLGSLCLANMAFIWPNAIYLLVIWERPGLGKYKWRLWRATILMLIGLFLCIAGTIVNFNELISIFRKK